MICQVALLTTQARMCSEPAIDVYRNTVSAQRLTCGFSCMCKLAALEVRSQRKWLVKQRMLHQHPGKSISASAQTISLQAQKLSTVGRPLPDPVTCLPSA